MNDITRQLDLRSSRLQAGEILKCMREKHLSVEAAPSAMASQMALSPGAQSGRRIRRTASRLWGMPVTSLWKRARC